MARGSAARSYWTSLQLNLGVRLPSICPINERMKLRGGDLVFTPLAFGAAFVAAVSFAPHYGLETGLVCAGVSLVLTACVCQIEITTVAPWRTHLRHMALIYPWSLIALLLTVGEGLVRPAGALLTAALIGTLVANAIVVAAASRAQREV